MALSVIILEISFIKENKAVNKWIIIKIVHTKYIIFSKLSNTTNGRITIIHDIQSSVKYFTTNCSKIINMKGIGIILRELRIEKGCTQKEVADVLGVTQDSISLWENDKRIPDAQYIITMAKFFDVSTDYLLGESSDYKRIDVGEGKDDIFVTSNELQLIYNYRKLSEEKKRMLEDFFNLLRK